MMAILWAKGPMWVKLRYLGGTVQAKVSPYDWNTSLTVGTDSIELIFAPRQSLRLKPSQVISLSYGQEAHRRVADAVTLSAVLSPLALFGLLHVSKDHIIGIVYQTGDGKRGAILLQCDKRDYWTILQTLKEVTGLPVESKP
jgi:hypothetical protein